MTRLGRLRGERCWSLFGLTLTSPHPFVNRLVESDAPADLWFRPVATSPIGGAWQGVEPGYRSPVRNTRGQHFLEVTFAPDATVFRFTEVVDFFVLPDGIAYLLHDEAYAFMVELHLLGFVLSYWLERAGWPALHASAVVVDGQAIGFASDHGGGKTSLAAAMLSSGHPLLSDDILAVGAASGAFVGRPGYPQMRMWPELARHFVGHDELELVHPGLTKRRVPVGAAGIGRFDAHARPLAALYLPERLDDDAEVRIDDLPGGAAVFALVRRSFLAGVVDGAGLSAARLALFGRLVRQVRVRRLRYPSGLQRLPAVARALEEDVRALAANDRALAADDRALAADDRGLGGTEP